MAGPLVWRGMQEYREELRQFPEACRGEAAKMIEGEVNGAYVTVKRVYEAHRFTGTLARRLTIAPLTVAGQLTTGLVLRSASRLAWLFDHGSQARHYVTVHGVTHLTGRMPGFHVFGRTAGVTRRKVRGLLIEMVRRRGATTVTDDGG